MKLLRPEMAEWRALMQSVMIGINGCKCTPSRCGLTGALSRK